MFFSNAKKVLKHKRFFKCQKGLVVIAENMKNKLDKTITKRSVILFDHSYVSIQFVSELYFTN
jgi:hypothetical protein